MTERRDDAAPTGRRLPGAPPAPPAPGDRPPTPLRTAPPGMVVRPSPRPGATPAASTSAAPGEDTRNVRAVGAFAASAAALLLAVAAGVVIALAPPPPIVDPSAAASGGLPADVVAALSSLRDTPRAAVEIRRIPQPPPPRPADASFTLPEGHPYRAWALRCPSTSTPPPLTEGPITPGTQTSVVIPSVPPVRCDVSLAGPGAATFDVRAGARVSCRMAGGLLCE